MVPCGPNCGGRLASGPGYVGPGREPHLLFGPSGFSLPPGLSLSVWIPTAPDLTRLHMGDLGCWLPHSGAQFPPDIFKFLPCLCPAQLLAGPYFSSLHKAVGGNHGFKLLIWSLPLSSLGGWDVAPCWEQATRGAAPELLHPRPPAAGCAHLHLRHAFLGSVRGKDCARGPSGPGGNTQALCLWSEVSPNRMELRTKYREPGGWVLGVVGSTHPVGDEPCLLSAQSCLQPKGSWAQAQDYCGAPFGALPLCGLPTAPLQALPRCDGQVPGSLL